MKLTKTWLSYILWGLFSIILFTDIGIAAMEIYQKAEGQVTWISIVLMYAYAIAGILAVIVIYKLVERFILPKLGEETPVLAGAAEIFAVVTVLIVAAAVRLIAVISSGGILEGTTVFYDYGVSVLGNVSLDTQSNGAYIYGNLLSFLLGFLGYKPASAMAIQSVIQLITIIVVYFAAKKGLGRLPAWLAFLMVSFLPGSFLLVKECTPDSLFTMFFAVYLLCLIYLCEANRNQKIKEKAHALFYVLLGVFSAFLAYYDVIGLFTVVIGIVAIIKTKNKEAWITVQRVWFQLMLYLLAFVFGLVLMLWFMPLNGCESGPAALVQYLMDCIPSFELNLMLLSPHKGQWDSLALFIMSGLWFAGFLRDDKDHAFPYVIMIDVSTLLVFLGIGDSEFSSLSSFAWIMLSAIGLSSLRRFRKNEKDVAAAEKAKRDNVARKEARERRRSAASGEKEIRLDHINAPSGNGKNADVNIAGSSFINDNLSKKSYGIGKKSGEVVSEPVKVEEIKNTEIPVINIQKEEPIRHAEMNSQRENPQPEQRQPLQEPERVIIKKEPAIRPETSSTTQPVARVAQVESRPEVKAPAPIPVESKPAYSYGSPSRRPLRIPSKSTFSPEELERIRQYTGMGITPPQQSGLNNHVRREEKVITPEQPMQETPTITQEPEVTVVAQPLAEEVKVENPFVEEVKVAQPLMEEVKVEQAESKPEEKTPEPVAVESKPAYSYGSPSRRPLRMPSKSTFSPEELERIRQYTGMNIAATSPTATEKPVDMEEKVAMPESRAVTQPSVSRTPAKTQADRQPKLIRNPLAGPKPHVARELNYDYVPKTSEMKFDIEDLKGRDYYDI